MVEFFSAPNEYNGSILKYKKENGTYYRIDTYFNGMFVVFYDNVPEKLYKQFERIMNSVKIIKMYCRNCNQIITSRRAVLESVAYDGCRLVAEKPGALAS